MADKTPSLSYKDAGVDINAGEQLVQRIKGVAKRTSRHTADLIPEALAQIKQMSPDLVVVTGDLVDYPFYALHDPEMIALGEKDLHMVRDLFSDMGCPVSYVYGNHDHRYRNFVSGVDA